MDTEALVLDLLVQQKQMEALQNYLMKTSMVEDEASQTFLFDLKDYVDSLSLVTIYETAPTIEERQVEEMSAILGDQAQTLRELIRQLEELEDAGKKVSEKVEGHRWYSGSQRNSVRKKWLFSTFVW